MASTADRILYRAYRDPYEYDRDLFEAYRSMYSSAPLIRYEEDVVDAHSFEYCLIRRYFVLVAPYTGSGQVLVQRSFADTQLHWALLGGSVRSDKMETFIDAADRHASALVGGIQLGEIEPIAFVENTFRYEGREHQHHGIVFAARIRNADPHQALRATISSRGHFIPIFGDQTITALSHHEEALDILRKYYRQLDFAAVPEREVSENQQYRARYAFHNKFVKPLFRFFGRFGFRHSLQDLDRCLLDLIVEDEHERILDVACGENAGITALAKIDGVRLTVGNDVSWGQIQLLQHRLRNSEFRGTGAMTIFTNHDARRLPFSDEVFDVALCKNVLHHMDDVRSARQLVNEMTRVARRSILIEIMDPAYEGVWGRLRHRYYMDFLKDAGRHFLSRTEFDALANSFTCLRRFEIQTIRGTYMFAVLSTR